MRKLQIFVAFISFTLLSACIGDDVNTHQGPTTMVYSLTNVMGGISGIDETFEMGLITWTFNSQTNMLEVVNNNTDDTSYDIFESGTYPYLVENDGLNRRMTIDGTDFGFITETSSQVTFEQQVEDGFTITLKR